MDPSTREAEAPERLRHLAAGVSQAILALFGLANLALLALALSRFRWGLEVEQLVFYYLAPAAGLGLAVASVRMRSDRRTGLGILLLSTAVTLVLVEAILVLGPGMLAAAGLSSMPEDWDTRSPREVVLDLRSEGTHAYPAVPGNVLVGLSPGFSVASDTVHPLAPAPGYATAFLCNETRSSPVIFRTDRYGFDNADEVWDRDRVDVALVGDSYTRGVCVDSEHQPASRLGTVASVLSLSASGAGPLQELALLREFGPRLRPRVVVWVYFEGNDLWDLTREEERQWLTRYLDASHRQELALHPGELDEAYGGWLDSLLAQRHYATERVVEPGWPELVRGIPRFRATRRLAGFEVPFPSCEDPLGLLPEVLARAKSDVEGWGGRMYLVYMPAFVRYRALLGDGVRGRAEVLGVADSLGISLIDLDPVFRATGDPRGLWAHPRGHLSPRGYRIFVDAVIDSIRPYLPGSKTGDRPR